MVISYIVRSNDNLNSYNFVWNYIQKVNSLADQISIVQIDTPVKLQFKITYLKRKLDQSYCWFNNIMIFSQTGLKIEPDR